MDGRLVALCIGTGGIPKHPLPRVQLTASGLEGDRQRQSFHGGPKRAVCLLTVEERRLLAADRVPCGEPGTFGENLLIEGLPPESLRPRMRLCIGPRAVIELEDVRSPCKTLRAIDPRLPELMVGRSGWVASVVVPGLLEVGMSVNPQ